MNKICEETPTPCTLQISNVRIYWHEDWASQTIVTYKYIWNTSVKCEYQVGDVLRIIGHSGRGLNKSLAQ